MSNCAIVGINWGDEGKGRMVDLVTADYDVVVRYQGGGNAGHTVVNEFGKFALHLLPSGIFRKGVVNILGNGVALDCESLWTEMSDVMDQGVAITPENLKISDRASLLLPWHRELDALEEQRLKDKKYGSTKQGIAPFYGDKYQKKTVMAGELLHPEHLREHLADLLEWKNLTLQKVYGAKGYTLDELLEQLRGQGCLSVEEVQYAVLENSGQLSVLPWAKAKPPTAEDLGLTLEEDALPTVLINDGRVLRNNLRLCGRDEVWLQKILKQEHCTTKEVFLLTVDENGKTLCVPKEADP